MPSAGACRATEWRVRAAWVSRATTSSTRLRGTLAARTIAECFGADVPVLPGGARAFHGRDDLRGLGAHPAAGDERPDAAACRAVRVAVSIELDAVGPPRTASASARQVARCSARVRGSCLACRVSRLACCARARASTMVGGRWCSRWNVGRQFALAVLDGRPTLRPAGVQRRVDADEFADRALAGVGGGPFGEPDGEGFGEAAFQGGVVDLGGGDDGLEQEASVDGEPASVEGLDLVRDRDVGVQVGVAGAAVAVGEPGGDQPGHVDLADAVVAGPGVEGVGLDEPQRVADRGEVGAFDGGRGGGFGERPQRRDALDRGEGEVVAGDGGGLRAGRRGDQPGEFAGVDGVASEGGPERLASDLGADRGADLRGDRRVVRGADLGVVGGEAFGDLDPELGHVVGVDLERLARAGSRRGPGRRWRPAGGPRRAGGRGGGDPIRTGTASARR